MARVKRDLMARRGIEHGRLAVAVADGHQTPVGGDLDGAPVCAGGTVRQPADRPGAGSIAQVAATCSSCSALSVEPVTYQVRPSGETRR